jgi:hypothetical protein
MRILIAGVLGCLAMYVWATIAHLSPLATIGVRAMPNEPVVVAALKLNLGDQRGTYVFPMQTPGGDTSKTTPQGVLAYTPDAPAGVSPRQLGVEFGLELVESLLMAGVAALAAAGFGRRLGIAVLVGLIAAMTTNASYWNWYGFGLDYTLATGFVELMKYVVAGVVIAAILGRRPKTAT